MIYVRENTEVDFFAEFKDEARGESLSSLYTKKLIKSANQIEDQIIRNNTVQKIKELEEVIELKNIIKKDKANFSSKFSYAAIQFLMQALVLINREFIISINSFLKSGE